MPRPNRVISPSVGASSPLMRLNNVVFPAPLGPMMARRSPGSTRRLTWSTARRPPNALETFERSKAGAKASSTGMPFVPAPSSDNGS